VCLSCLLISKPFRKRLIPGRNRAVPSLNPSSTAFSADRATFLKPFDEAVDSLFKAALTSGLQPFLMSSDDLTDLYGSISVYRSQKARKAERQTRAVARNCPIDGSLRRGSRISASPIRMVEPACTASDKTMPLGASTMIVDPCSNQPADEAVAQAHKILFPCLAQVGVAEKAPDGDGNVANEGLLDLAEPAHEAGRQPSGDAIGQNEVVAFLRHATLYLLE
jgi:hypothetical protein